LNGVGGDVGGVDDDVADERAVEEVLQAEVEVGCRAGDGGAEVLVGRSDRDVRRVVAVGLDDGWR